MSRRLRLPRFRCEDLESRTAPAVLTVLVPDGPETDLNPTLDLATAVANRTGRPVDVGGAVARYDATAGALTAPAARSDVLVLDWAGTPDAADDVAKAGTKLADYLRTLLPAEGRLDLHFIGHGTGSYVVLAAVRALAADDGKVGRLQVTSLNALAPPGAEPPLPPPLPLPPEPVPLPGPPTEPPGGVPPDGGGPGIVYPEPWPWPRPDPEPPLTGLPVPYTVDLADNYYVTAGTPGLRLKGEAVGTEIDLTAALGQWPGRAGERADHAEVRDWYHWTVDLANAPGQTPYRDTGLNAQLAGFAGQGPTRASLFAQQIDLDKDGQNDDLAAGSAIGFGQSIQTLFAPRDRTYTGLDLALVIDTTGSMADDIDAVKARAVEILQTLRQQTPDVRVGLVLYRDFPDGSHGAPDDYQALVALAFTADLDAADAAVRAITVDGGNDWPESVYSGLRAVTDPAAELGEWRGGSVRKSVILMGDAPPQMTEPGTGFTKTSDLLRAVRAGVDVATVATTATADAWWMFQSIAQLTGGNFYFTGPAPGPGGEWGDGGYGWGSPYPVDWFGPGGTPPPGSPPVPPPPGGGPGGAGGGGYAAAAAESVLSAVRDIGSGVGVPPPRSGPILDPVYVAPGTGGDGRVRFVDAASGAINGEVPAFDAPPPGGVRTAAGDFNRDGVDDLIVGTGPGVATRVRVLDAVTRNELFAVDPFEAGFTGGVNVAAGDVTGDGVDDLVITPDEGGGPRVRVFDGKTFGQVADFFGIDDANFRGGARAAVGDVDGDGTGDLIVAAGFQGGPRVAGFSGRSLGGSPARVFSDFFAFEQGLRNGVFVAAGDVDGDGFAEVIAGGGPGGGPRVTAFSGKSLLGNAYDVKANFFGGDEASRGGIRVAVKDLDSDDRADLVVGPGDGSASRVTAYLGKDVAAAGTPPVSFDIDAVPGFAGGVFVG